RGEVVREEGVGGGVVGEGRGGVDGGEVVGEEVDVVGGGVGVVEGVEVVFGEVEVRGGEEWGLGDERREVWGWEV
ncbi:hypothetical protein, partial [Kocuria salsicia]|uniref:hypothetical protein n=1 Tax=Kocuria salsicia TaxID=664639 RepID=UPI0021B67E82